MKPFAALSGAMLVAACAHDLGLMKKEETLNAYRAAIRWNAFEQANAFRSAQAPPRRSSEELRNIHVTGYDVLAEREDKERLTLNQTVAIRYYRTDDLIEKTAIDEQRWHYDPDRGRWALDSALPAFK